MRICALLLLPAHSFVIGPAVTVVHMHAYTGIRNSLRNKIQMEGPATVIASEYGLYYVLLKAVSSRQSYSREPQGTDVPLMQLPLSGPRKYRVPFHLIHSPQSTDSDKRLGNHFVISLSISHSLPPSLSPHSARFSLALSLTYIHKSQ
jgi:hypothetical protein